MIVHTEKTSGLIGVVSGENYGCVVDNYQVVLRDRAGDERLDHYYAADLADAFQALHSGLAAGNFDKFRAQKRWLEHAENDTLDLY